MQSQPKSHLVLHVATLAIWLLAAASVTYWTLLTTQVRGPAGRADVAFVAVDAVDTALLARLLGTKAAISPQAQTAAVAASRFALKGVVSGAPGSEAALISVNEQPAKPFRVGNELEPGVLLKSVTARKVILSSTSGGPALVTLEMPALDK